MRLRLHHPQLGRHGRWHLGLGLGHLSRLSCQDRLGKGMLSARQVDHRRVNEFNIFDRSFVAGRPQFRQFVNPVKIQDVHGQPL